MVDVSCLLYFTWVERPQDFKVFIERVDNITYHTVLLRMGVSIFKSKMVGLRVLPLDLFSSACLILFCFLVNNVSDDVNWVGRISVNDDGFPA